MIIKQLQLNHTKLVNKFNILLHEYKGYQKFFRKEDAHKAVEKANMRYYSYMYNLLEIDFYDEGKFSLEHKSLSSKMKENRKDRNELIIKITESKRLIKKIISNDTI